MHMTQRFTKRLPGKILVLAGASILVCGLLTLSFAFVAGRASQVAYASSALHPFTITSPDFTDGGPLSSKAEFNQDGCTGSNVAPVLRWKNVPQGTRSFVLLLSDYDAPVAGGFHHWIVYNIPANARSIKGNNAFTEGTNDYGLLGYGGPCPPATGETHHYLFLLYAINVTQVGTQGLTFGQVMNVIQNDVVGATSIIGTFHLPQ